MSSRAGELGVEEPAGGHADLEQAGQVLAGRVDDPLGVAKRRAELGQGEGAVEGGRVDEVGAGARPTQLQQVGALGVPKAVRSLGVDRQRSSAGAERSDGGFDLLGGGLDLGSPVGRCDQQPSRRLRLRGLRFGSDVG